MSPCRPQHLKFVFVFWFEPQELSLYVLSLPLSGPFDTDVCLPHRLSFSLEVYKFVCIKYSSSYICFAILCSSLKYDLAISPPCSSSNSDPTRCLDKYDFKELILQHWLKFEELSLPHLTPFWLHPLLTFMPSQTPVFLGVISCSPAFWGAECSLPRLSTPSPPASGRVTQCLSFAPLCPSPRKSTLSDVSSQHLLQRIMENSTPPAGVDYVCCKTY